MISFLEQLHGADGRALWPAEGVNLHTSNAAGRDQMKSAIENLPRSVRVEVESSAPGGQPRFVIRLQRARE